MPTDIENNKKTEEVIRILEEMQFKSVNDFDSVKRLRKDELFFSKNDLLEDFQFPSHQSQINSTLLSYINIEIHLDRLFKKSGDLLLRGYHSEGMVTKDLVFHIRNLNRWYFKEKIIDYADYKARTLSVIDQARPILEQHRGYKKLLANLILLIVTLGTAFIVNKAVNDYFLFFQKTESAKQLDRISQILVSENHISR